ncbi:MAG: hypothetical protein ACE5EY_03585 [Anaerolineae bacterium]
MTKFKTTNIVRMDWLRNRTPTGKRSATKARKLAQYLAFGRGRPQEQMERPQRGQWLDESGRPCTHQEVLDWVIQQGKENQFTHQFILSVKDTPLTSESFNRAMAAGGDLFPKWRLIQHTDTRYPHAHALAFGQKEVRIKSEAFREWWLGVRAALERERQTHLAQQQQSQWAQGLQQQPEPTDRRQLVQGIQPQGEAAQSHSLADGRTAVLDTQQQMTPIVSI